MAAVLRNVRTTTSPRRSVLCDGDKHVGTGGSRLSMGAASPTVRGGLVARNNNVSSCDVSSTIQGTQRSSLTVITVKKCKVHSR